MKLRIPVAGYTLLEYILNEDIRKELKIPTITETIETSGMNTF